MGALQQFRPSSVREVTREPRPLAGGVKAYRGALAMCITSGGHAGFYAPADGSKTGVVVGRFFGPVDVDNTTGADGDAQMEIHYLRERHVFLLDNDTGTPVAVANRETTCNALDDHTATMAAESCVAGVVYDVTTEGVWVEIDAQPTAADADTAVQAGTGVLVNGVSAAIPATITATSRIIITRKDIAASTAVAELQAKSADRTVGSPGSFKVTSEKDDASGVQTGDQSTFDWVVIG